MGVESVSSYCLLVCFFSLLENMIRFCLVFALVANGKPTSNLLEYVPCTYYECWKSREKNVSSLFNDEFYSRLATGQPRVQVCKV